jgi:hypothetical protein
MNTSPSQAERIIVCMYIVVVVEESMWRRKALVGVDYDLTKTCFLRIYVFHPL